MNEDQQRALESVLLANWGKQPSEIINALYLNGFAIVPVSARIDLGFTVMPITGAIEIMRAR